MRPSRPVPRPGTPPPRSNRPESTEQRKGRDNAADKTKRRMSPKFTIFVAIGVVAAAFVVCMMINIIIGVRTIVIKGNDLASYDEITAVAGIEQGSGYFSYNTGKSENKVISEIHCISEINISRSVFGRVTIEVVEKKPCWYIELYGEYYALTEDLEVIRRADLRDDFIRRGLVRLDLPEILSAVLGKRLEYADGDRDCSFLPDFLSEVRGTKMFADGRIDQLKLETKFEIFVVCDLKYKINLGKYSGAALKLSSVEKAMEDKMFSESYTFEIDASDVGNITARVNDELNFSYLRPLYGE